MSIRVEERDYGFGVERQVTLGEKRDRINIHPWDRDYPYDDRYREVYLAIGDLKKNGDQRNSGALMTSILDRDDFVEAILAVFPELKRVED